MLIGVCYSNYLLIINTHFSCVYKTTGVNVIRLKYYGH